MFKKSILLFCVTSFSIGLFGMQHHAIALSQEWIDKTMEQEITIKLAEACNLGNAKTASELIAQLPNLNGMNGISCIILRTIHEGTGFHDAIKWLLGNKLKRAVARAHPRAVKILLKVGADINTLDDFGESSLHKVLDSVPHLGVNRALKIIKTLREHNIRPLTTNADGENPFLVASFKTQKKQLLAGMIAPLSSETLKADARKRFVASTLVLRNSWIKLPPEVIYKIFSHMPIDCYYSGSKKVFVPKEEREAFRMRFVEECWPLLPTLLSKEEAKKLHNTLNCELYNEVQDKYYKIVDHIKDPEIARMLDPKTWEQPKE